MHWFIPIICLLMSWTSASEPTKGPKVDPCQLSGAVFVEEVESFAKYRVFVEDVEHFSDLRVYKEDLAGFASKPGHWHFTSVREFADFTVAFVPLRSSADFSIYYTEFQSLAGCQ